MSVAGSVQTVADLKSGITIIHNINYRNLYTQNPDVCEGSTYLFNSRDSKAYRMVYAEELPGIFFYKE